jgi:hypothetical protein
MCFASCGQKKLGRFQSVARSGRKNRRGLTLDLVFGPKGQESIAQGLPWVIAPTRISPEGATRYGENRLRTFETDRLRQFPAPLQGETFISTFPG